MPGASELIQHMNFKVGKLNLCLKIMYDCN